MNPYLVCVCIHVHMVEHDMPELKCSNPTSPSQGAHLQLQVTEPKSNKLVHNREIIVTFN